MKYFYNFNDGVFSIDEDVLKNAEKTIANVGTESASTDFKINANISSCVTKGKNKIATLTQEQERYENTNVIAAVQTNVAWKNDERRKRKIKYDGTFGSVLSLGHDIEEQTEASVFRDLLSMFVDVVADSFATLLFEQTTFETKLAENSSMDIIANVDIANVFNNFLQRVVHKEHCERECDDCEHECDDDTPAVESDAELRMLVSKITKAEGDEERYKVIFMASVDAPVNEDESLDWCVAYAKGKFMEFLTEHVAKRSLAFMLNSIYSDFDSKLTLLNGVADVKKRQ